MKPPTICLDNLKPLLLGRLPGQLIIQYSNHCNADCPQCAMRRSNPIDRHTLDPDTVRKIIDRAARSGIKSLSFTGGEPLLFLDKVVELIDYASSAGIPYVRTGTNGFFLRDAAHPDFHRRVSQIAEKLAATRLYTFWFSLDSANPDDHESMRRLRGVVKGIEKALPIFHQHGIYPSANLGINRAIGGVQNQPYLKRMSAEDFQQSFQDGFERYYQFVCGLGFTIANSCYPMSERSDAVTSSIYGAASKDDIITFSKEEKALIFRALFETIPKYRGRLRIFSPRCALYGLHRKFVHEKAPLFPCRGGTDFFFVECHHGQIYPCGYLEEPIDQFPDLQLSRKKVADCDRCDWECFRDPSDLLGPFAELFAHPLSLSKKIINDPRFFKLLWEDMRYYRACGFFNGRQPPQFNALQPFERP